MLNVPNVYKKYMNNDLIFKIPVCYRVNIFHVTSSILEQIPLLAYFFRDKTFHFRRYL